MKLIKKTNKINNIVSDLIERIGPDSDIVRRLRQLPENYTEEDIYKYAPRLGRAWTENVCTECETENPVLVLLGEEEAPHNSSVEVCKACLLRAVRKIQADSRAPQERT